MRRHRPPVRRTIAPLTGADVVRRSGNPIRAHGPLLAVLAVLVVWTFAPLVLLLQWVIQHGGTLTGANGIDSYDQLQYLAWIRDGGSHWLASDLWHVGPSAHDYLHPMYFVSSLLWRLGVGVQLAYMIWKPVAMIVLFAGCVMYVRHLLPGRRWQQAAALFLALFYLTPALQLADWTGRVNGIHRLELLTTTNDSASALTLWGFEHAAFTVGLMPIFLIAAERVLARGARAERRWTAIGAVAGLLVAWLHPWQGVMLLAIPAVMFVVRPPRRRYLSLAVPLAATVLPLAYGVALSRFDPQWQAFQAKTVGGGTGPWWALAVGFGPLLLAAAFGVRRPRDDRTWMLLLWVLTCAAVFFFIPEFPPHALTGLPVPLSVLAVMGWERVRERVHAPRLAAGAAAVLVIAFFTVPAAIYQWTAVETYRADTPGGAAARTLVVLSPDQSAALAYLQRSPAPGAVLASQLLSMSIPGLTGREVYAGHVMWQPSAHDLNADAFFAPGGETPAGRRAILAAAGVRFVVTDCGTPVALARAIAPVTTRVGQFGCVGVYRYTGVPGTSGR
jgi:hypothetical protein